MNDVPLEKRVIPAIIDYRNEHTPEKRFALLPNSDNLKDGFYELTYRAMAQAVDRMAWWLDSNLSGESVAENPADFPTVPYIGANDFRYALLLVACMKTRRKLFMPLSANTVQGQVKLLQMLKCSAVLASASHAHVWDRPMSHMDGLEVIVVPELSYFIHGGPIKQYPYDRTKAKASDDIVCVVQTSGTTGDPKPIEMSARGVDYWADMLATQAGAPDEREVCTALVQNGYIPNFLPISWSMGVTQVLIWPLTCASVPIMLPTTMPQPVTAEYVYQVIGKTPKGPKNGLLFVPSVLRAFADNMERLTSLEKYGWVGYAGAPLDERTGDRVSQYTRVQSFMGATDIGPYPFVLNDPRDWKIHRLHPAAFGFHFQHFTDDFYELCVHRQPHEHRHCFTMNPDSNLTVAHTKDLFHAVPGREGFYSTAGRVDDFVKLSSLTKFNAIDIESIIERNPDVDGSVVAGDGRAKPFVILEPSQSLRESLSSEKGIIDHVWSSFEEANRTLHSDALLIKELTLVSAATKPIKRTAKGTVDRRNTILMYTDRIEQVYLEVGS